MLILMIDWIWNLGGRLHPVMVHFPIGLLLGAFILKLIYKLRRKPARIDGMIHLAAVTAIASALFGFFLKSTGNYSGVLADQHQWSGYLTTVLTVLTSYAYLQARKLPPWFPDTCLYITCLGIIVTGHLGASLTHGKNYLFQTSSTSSPSSDRGLYTELQNRSSTDTLSPGQLDRLNLEVRAIFAHKCYKCHSTAKSKGGLALDHKEGVFAGGDEGFILQKGQSKQSEIIRRLRLRRSHEDAMPPKGEGLLDEEIALIALWIDEDAHWSDKAFKEFREAELELSPPSVPTAYVNLSHPIDKFVFEYFEEREIPWPEKISDRGFIRRASLDITGLLPPEEEARRFITDKNVNKREDLIDSLLADQEDYVLHWLSFWNDLLRNDYSGTGFITGGREQITSWLYESLYEDKAYDQMVSELINPNDKSRGFIRGIQWRGEVNASQRTELQAAQNVSQSLLGLNLKCASCHDSFVNNVSLDQAYGFANIFAKESLKIYRCDKATGRIAQTAFLYPELGEVNSDDRSERLEQLAKIIVQPRNGRLYRTIVNRYWDRLFGRGIIAPVDEMDQLPWSQELLDWLASDFILNGKDFKKLIKRIMTSDTYQMSSAIYPSNESLTSESFVFKGPVVRRMTAEQFSDAFSMIIHPLYHGVAFDPDQNSRSANWIWKEEIELDRRVLPKPGTRLFRKTFSIDPGIIQDSIEILITVDHAFVLHLNGEQLASGENWRSVNHMIIPSNLLQKENVIAIEAKNDGDIPNPAGLLFAMRVNLQDQDPLIIQSDPSWKTRTDTTDNQWIYPSFNDDGWENAWIAGRGERSHWGSLLRFSFDTDRDTLSFVRASLVRQDEFMKTLGRPVREIVTTRRSGDISLLQSLMLTNDPFLHENIANGARSWIEKTNGRTDRLVEELYSTSLGRIPTANEKRITNQIFKNQSLENAVEDLIWAIILLPEFQMI